MPAEPARCVTHRAAALHHGFLPSHIYITSAFYVKTQTPRNVARTEGILCHTDQQQYRHAIVEKSDAMRHLWVCHAPTAWPSLLNARSQPQNAKRVESRRTPIGENKCCPSKMDVTNRFFLTATEPSRFPVTHRQSNNLPDMTSTRTAHRTTTPMRACQLPPFLVRRRPSKAHKICISRIL